VKRSNRLLILLGLLIAISASLAAAAYVSSGGGGATTAEASATPTPEPMVEVVAAATDIPAGAQITSGMLTMKSITISERDSFGGDTFDKIDNVVDRMAGSDIKKDQVIVASKDLLAPGSFLDGKSLRDSIRPGMVAISMELDQVNGVGTIIVPGDHVDVILSVWVDQMSITFKDSSGNTSNFTGAAQVTTKMVIQDCRVLATLLPPAAATPNQTVAPAAAGSAPLVTPAPTSATVQFTGRHMIAVIEVLPDEAEVIRWAQRAEKNDPQNYIDLALVLRSSQDDTATRDTSCDGAPCIKTTGVTFKVLVEKYKVLPPDPSWTLPEGLRAKVQW
jgi:Flp pilus assembly protein CpaB